MSEEGRLAQLVERLVYTEEVGSSTLSPPTNVRAGTLFTRNKERPDRGPRGAWRPVDRVRDWPSQPLPGSG